MKVDLYANKMLITGSHSEPKFQYDVIYRFSVCGFTITYGLEIGQEQNRKYTLPLKSFSILK